jgi:hypothetical protein
MRPRRPLGSAPPKSGPCSPSRRRVAVFFLIDGRSSCSNVTFFIALPAWGLGQVMGMNFQAAGLAEALKDHDWRAFARVYNGADYAAHNYDGLLEHFFQRYSAGNTPDLRIRAAQIYLTYKEFKPGPVDGVLGHQTQAAVGDFQRSIPVQPTGIIDDDLIAQLLS